MPLNVEKSRQQDQEYSQEWFVNKDPGLIFQLQAICMKGNVISFLQNYFTNNSQRTQNKICIFS